MATPLTADIVTLPSLSSHDVIEIDVFKITADVIEGGGGGGGGGGSPRPSNGFLYPRGY